MTLFPISQFGPMATLAPINTFFPITESFDIDADGWIDALSSSKFFLLNRELAFA